MFYQGTETKDDIPNSRILDTIKTKEDAGK